MSILRMIFSGEADPAILLSLILSRVFVIFFCMPIHESAHAWAAAKMGDNTSKNLGRITLNPFVHLDVFGTIMLLLFGIGFAKPVTVRERNFKNPKKGMALTALAGPAANLLMAFVFSWIYYIFIFVTGNAGGAAIQLVQLFLYYAFYVNVSLAVFNLIPIPPLDGSKVFAMLLPTKIYFKYLQYERYIMIGLIVLLFTGILGIPISFLSDKVSDVISFIPRIVFTALAS